MMPLWTRGVAVWARASVLGVVLSLSAAAATAATDTVVEIRVHGNHSIPDDEVVELAGIALGDVVDNGVLDSVARRLTDSGRFETVDVYKRYWSLTATDRIALVMVVRERAAWAARRPADGPAGAPLRGGIRY